MANKNSLVVQDLTFTQKQYGVAVTVTYVNGAALAVLVSGTDITVTLGAASTATQIAAAVNARVDAAYLVSVAVTGTGATVQLSCVNATLAGGVAAAKATLVVDGTLLLTAAATGTGGNSTRIKFTAGATAGSEVSSASGSDITVQIADGVSTYAQVKAAIDGDAGSHALVAVTSAGVSLTKVAQVSAALAFTSLAGGVAAAAAKVVIQDLTFTYDTAGVAGNGVTVSFTDGATAGSEVVSGSASAIVCQIQSGTSTATQIATAMEASAISDGSVETTVSGTGSTAQVTVNAAALASAVGEGALAYYITQATTALTASFVNFNFAFHASVVVLTNDEMSGTKVLVGSFDGVNTDFTLNFGESLTFDPCDLTHVFMKYSGAAPAYRLMATRTRG